MNIHGVSGFSFENRGGNPAGVVISDKMLSEDKMLEITKEVNYSEINSGFIKLDVENINNTKRTAIYSVNTKTELIEEEIKDKFITVFNFTSNDLDNSYPIKKSYSANYHFIIFLKIEKLLKIWNMILKS